jgi:hypothetical protein
MNWFMTAVKKYGIKKIYNKTGVIIPASEMVPLLASLGIPNINIVRTLVRMHKE